MATQKQDPESGRKERQRTNAELLDEIVSRHGAKLRRQARSNAQLPRDAEDALQEAYALFLEHYDGRWPALPFLMTTVKRCAWQIRKRASRQREVSPETIRGTDSETDLWDIVEGSALDPAERIERDDEVERRREAFSQLKPDQQRALLQLGAGMSYREIAKANEWTYTKVNRCVSDGRAQLRMLRHG